VHTSGGYLTYASYTHGTVFDLREDDVYACVADVGWITGHTYIVYGPLANGATTLMFESSPPTRTPGGTGTWSSGTRSHLLHRAHRDPGARRPGRRAS
jgi:acyl-coenzyme A synthetase/AMP-(fatty) acid ligase